MTKAVVPRCSVKKGVLRNFAKFTGKYLCQNLLFNKAAGLSPANLLKKRLRYRCFPVKFAKFLRPPFFYRTSLVAASFMTLESSNSVWEAAKRCSIKKCAFWKISQYPLWMLRNFQGQLFYRTPSSDCFSGFWWCFFKNFQNIIKMTFGLKSSHRRCSVKKSVLKKFGKFTGKRMCQRLFFSKVAGLGLFIKKRSWRKCFLVNFLKCLRTLFYRTRPDNCFVVFLRNLFKGKKFSFQTDPIYLITKFTSVIFIFTQVCKKKYSWRFLRIFEWIIYPQDLT